jgi:hypothetical protein
MLDFRQQGMGLTIGDFIITASLPYKLRDTIEALAIPVQHAQERAELGYLVIDHRRSRSARSVVSLRH